MPNYLTTVGATFGPAPAVLGQIVVEGVVVRAPGAFAVAIRRPTGEIVVRERSWPAWSHRSVLWRWPIVRGVVACVEGLWAQARALIFAAEQAGIRGPLACATVGLRVDSPAELARKEAACDSKMPINSSGEALGVTFWAALGALVALVLMPGVLASTLSCVWACSRLQAAAIYVVGGALKLGFLGLYLWHLHRLPQMRRLMMYHGAEHKVLLTYERGLPLDVAHARRASCLHPRSGVAWALWTTLIATASGLLLFSMPHQEPGLQTRLALGALRALLWLPAIGLGYEVSHWTGARLHRPWVRALVAPGLLVQRLTVREPTDAVLEVALVALRAALSRGGRAPACNSRQERFGLPKLVSACARQGARAAARGGLRGSARVHGPFAVTARMDLG